MEIDPDTRYYLAVVASGISVLGWAGVVGFGAYAVYRSLTRGSVLGPANGVLISFVVGVVFALIEKRLYRLDSG